MANDEQEVGKRQDEVREEYRRNGLKSEELRRRGKAYDAALKKRDAERRSK